jgi:hypothetical protein
MRVHIPRRPVGATTRPVVTWRIDHEARYFACVVNYSALSANASAIFNARDFVSEYEMFEVTATTILRSGTS